MIYRPDIWQVIEITSSTETIYKVFATWYGGYIAGEQWKLNSGITQVNLQDDTVEFTGTSGSVYVCPKHENAYRTSAYSYGILAKFLESKEYAVRVLPYNTNWNKLV
jgi:hypothetical protein